MAKTGLWTKVKRALCFGHADEPSTSNMAQDGAPGGCMAHAAAGQLSFVFVKLQEVALAPPPAEPAPTAAPKKAEQQQLAEALARFTSRPNRSQSVDAPAVARLSFAALASSPSLASPPSPLPGLKLPAKPPQDLHPSFAPLRSSQQWDWSSADQGTKAAGPQSPTWLFYMSTMTTTFNTMYSAASANAAYRQLSGLSSSSQLSFPGAGTLTQAAEEQHSGPPSSACADWSVSMGHGCNRTRTSARSAWPCSYPPSGAAATCALSERPADAPTVRRPSTLWITAA